MMHHSCRLDVLHSFRFAFASMHHPPTGRMQSAQEEERNASALQRLWRRLIAGATLSALTGPTGDHTPGGNGLGTVSARGSGRVRSLHHADW